MHGRQMYSGCQRPRESPHGWTLPCSSRKRISAASAAIVASHTQHSTSSACIAYLLSVIADLTCGHSTDLSTQQRIKQVSCQRPVMLLRDVVEQGMQALGGECG